MIVLSSQKRTAMLRLTASLAGGVPASLTARIF